MEYFTLLLVGCVVGMQHALEADHLAAVAALTVRHPSRRALVLRGCAWGLGHTITLLAICSVLMFLGGTMTSDVEAALELAVGVILVFLGGNALFSVVRRRLQFVPQQHEKGFRHTHTLPDGLVSREDANYDHTQVELGLGSALIVGIMHGAAGSAGLLVLAAATSSIVEGIGYVAAFGIGSTAGMAALSLVAFYPVKLIEQSANWINAVAFACIGFAAIVIGALLISDSWSSLSMSG